VKWLKKLTPLQIMKMKLMTNMASENEKNISNRKIENAYVNS